MKKKDLPQDNEGIHEGKFRDLCYVVDQDGNYVTAHSTGWSPKNTAMLQAWEVIHEKVEETRHKVISGELSPIAYFMEKNMLDIKVLSQYTGIPKRKVKRHLKPVVFQDLDNETLEQYADAFEMTVEELKDTFSLND